MVQAQGLVKLSSPQLRPFTGSESRAVHALHSKPSRSQVTKTPCLLSSDCSLLAVLPQAGRTFIRPW